MKKFLSLFLVMALVCSVNLVNAQNVYACENYTSTGEPEGEGAVWTIQPGGGNIYLLYNHGSRRGGMPSKVFYYIDKKSGGSYKEFATEPVAATSGKSFVVLDYKFTEAGDYKIGVYTEDEKLLAETSITVNLSSGSSTSTTTSSSNTDYYANSKIIFCEEVKSNSPINAASSFIIGKGGGYLQVQVDNGKALKTKELVVKVYKKGKGSSDYNEFVEKLTFPIEEHWDRPYFQYDFLTAGEYVFDIYTANDVWINSGYVTIKYK